MILWVMIHELIIGDAIPVPNTIVGVVDNILVIIFTLDITSGSSGFLSRFLSVVCILFLSFISPHKVIFFEDFNSLLNWIISKLFVEFFNERIKEDDGHDIACAVSL